MPSPSRPDWSRIDHVLLDLDGTILDLAYDNHFWTEALPVHYAARHGLSVEEAAARLEPMFTETQGSLAWYCLDHWSRATGLDIATIKRETRERIRPLEGSEAFLRAVRASGRPVWLVTNAHPGSWQLKFEQTGIGTLFDRVLSSHDFGVPKEHPEFWDRLRAAHPFEPARALFADDSAAVLRTARAYGIGTVITMRRPDSRHPARACDGMPGVEHLGELLPVEAWERLAVGS